MTTDDLTVSTVLAALPSSDLSRSEAYVEQLIGRPADERPMPVVAQWHLGTGTLQLVHDPQRAGGGLMTLVVPDMTAAVAGMRGRGLDVSADQGAVVAQVLVVTDPDGNQITVVEARNTD